MPLFFGKHRFSMALADSTGSDEQFLATSMKQQKKNLNLCTNGGDKQMDNSDLDYTVDRLVRGEEQIAKEAGFGATKQGRALAQKYLAALETDIAQDRKRADDKAVWRALKGLDDKAIAIRLLVPGIALADSKDLGVDRETGEKVYRCTPGQRFCAISNDAGAFSLSITELTD
jgi:hypothetical protein